MPSVFVMLKKDYVSKGDTYPVVIKLKDGRKQFVYNTKYKVKKSQFKDGKVIKHDLAEIINGVIFSKVKQAHTYFAECAMDERPVNLKSVFQDRAGANFGKYILHRAQQYKSKGMVIMWQKLSRFQKELKECFGEVYFDDVTADKLREFEIYLKKNGNHPNTIAKKFRFLKQLFQSALDEELHSGVNPFKKHKIQTYPTKKEKLSLAEIKAIESLDLTGPVNDARNLFLFSYYAKGARFENCIFLKREQIRDGRVVFKTNKGKKYISVLISSKLQAILDQYPTGEFIFPFVTIEPEDPFEYRSLKDVQNSIINRLLKTVGGLAKVKTPLTFHLARHSIAMAMKNAKIDIHGIKEALGHSDTRTTEIYLKGLDDERLDEDMKKVYGD